MASEKVAQAGARGRGDDAALTTNARAGPTKPEPGRPVPKRQAADALGRHRPPGCRAGGAVARWAGRDPGGLDRRELFLAVFQNLAVTAPAPEEQLHPAILHLDDLRGDP